MYLTQFTYVRVDFSHLHLPQVLGVAVTATLVSYLTPCLYFVVGPLLQKTTGKNILTGSLHFGKCGKLAVINERSGKEG